MRFETLPGEQAQVDWGYLGEIYDREEKRTVKLYCFLMILGYSRMLYVEEFENMRFENFLKGHNHAFRYYGGYTRELLYDNLKSVVIKRALLAKDSNFNKKFMDFAGFYGFKPILCRPYKPNTKGKVEKSVDFVKQNFYLGREFLSLKDVNQQLSHWLEEANQRFHATVKERPIERWARETLITLDNKTLYDLTPFYWRKVSRECFFSFEGNYYSVPYLYAGKDIHLKKEDKKITVYYRKEKIAIHALLPPGKGHFIRKDEHFKGLLEIRCKHRLKKPQRSKKMMPPKIIRPLSPINIPIVPHELSCYEEVI
ncbi:MAG: Mobile element protein [Gammaproteobacteria bacterium]|nr:Mobile element protein [Gammaproteobacteria bacterium]